MYNQANKHIFNIQQGVIEKNIFYQFPEVIANALRNFII